MSTDPTSSRPTRHHPLEVGYLVMGLAFLTMVGIWALLTADVASDDDLRFLLPVPWVLGGAVGLLALGIGAARRNRASASPTTDTTTHPDDTWEIR